MLKGNAKVLSSTLLLLASTVARLILLYGAVESV